VNTDCYRWQATLLAAAAAGSARLHVLHKPMLDRTGWHNLKLPCIAAMLQTGLVVQEATNELVEAHSH
jgi:hypothetical protein